MEDVIACHVGVDEKLLRLESLEVAHGNVAVAVLEKRLFKSAVGIIVVICVEV